MKTARWRAALVVLAVLGTAYALTLAPGLTWWDAGELAAAAHGFGIPHPPGTPLYVAIARSWHLALAGVPTVLATNVLSAVATAAGCAVLAAWLAGVLDDAVAGAAAGVAAGVMTSIWRNATETEVYALILLAVALVLWCAHRAGTTGEPRWRRLTVYALALGTALHPGTLVVAPAALVLLWPSGWPPGWMPRALRARWGAELLRVAVVTVVALSALLMLWVRARHDPWLNQGNPSSLAAWQDVVGRAQYARSGLWPRQSPWWAQLGMVVQYLDWQFALGVSPSAVPTWGRAALSAVGVALVGAGARWHWRRDRRSSLALAALLAGGTLGAALALNFKAGWSFSLGHFVDGMPREVRERDYFFSFGFAACGLWFGLGARAVAGAVARAWPVMERRRAVVVAAVVAAVVALPLLLNWRAVTRRGSDAGLASAYARRVLAELPPRAIFVARGDNELYPLWYVQAVEQRRPDVLVLAEPLLPARWYRDELDRRHGVDVGGDWPGVDEMRARVAGEAGVEGRPVLESVMASDSAVHALWERGRTLVPGHAEPFSRLVAAVLLEAVVVRRVER
ncbi:MAG: protein O-mannosyl-transferase family [Gemmatimonadaceae bacterium]